MSLTAALSLSTHMSPVRLRSLSFISCSSHNSASPAFFFTFLDSFSTAWLFFFTTALIFLKLLECSLSNIDILFLHVSNFDCIGVERQSEIILETNKVIMANISQIYEHYYDINMRTIVDGGMLYNNG